MKYLPFSFLLLILMVFPFFAQRRADGLQKVEISKELKDKLIVTEAEKHEFEKILKNFKGKISKIWNNLCSGDKQVIDINDKPCIEQLDFVPGSNFMFSVDPRNSALANISLIKNEFWAESGGAAKTQLLVDLGNVSIGQIDKHTKAVVILDDCPITTFIKETRRNKKQTIFDYQGLKIVEKTAAELNHTYLLRTVLHRSVWFPHIERFETIWRSEDLYVFQVVKQQDNVTTIVWKKIFSKFRQDNEKNS